MRTPIDLVAALAGLLALGAAAAATAAAAAEPLAVFECREILGRDWPRTLVTYPLEFKAGQARPGEVRLLDAQGKEVPSQLSRVMTHPDGTIATARLSFHAELLKGGSYRYSLEARKPAPATKVPTAHAQGDRLTLDNGIVAIRLPAGQRRFSTPLAMAGDHATAMERIDDLGQAGIAYGPIAGIRLGDGRWVGGSYFSTEPAEAVRQRQQHRADAPDVAAGGRGGAVAAPKIISCDGQVTEQGALFVEARVRFAFDNGGHYQLTARVLADDPAIRIDEVMDLKGNCPPEHPLYVTMLLNDGWKGDGWRPDAAFVMTTRRSTRSEPFEAALTQHGIASKYASIPIDHSQDQGVVTEVVPHDPWSERAHYVGLVNSAQLRADRAAPFLGIVPLHAGSWRATHWAFPPKSPLLFQQLLAWKDGSLAMRWTVRAQPHPQNLLHTGEFDPAFGLTGMRRIWCLVGGPFQYHDALHPFRFNEGYVNLDNYKDWDLAWTDDTKLGVQQPILKADLDGALFRQMSTAFSGADDREYRWFAHYRQAESSTWAVAVRKQLADASIPAARRGQLRAQVAALCYLMAEPDFNTRASMTHQGNPNMPINRFFALPFAAAVIPDHPMAKTWLDVSADVARYKLSANTAPLGAWAELISYYGASAPTLVHGALAAHWQGRLGPGTAGLAAGPVDFTLKLLSPVDPRFKARAVPGFGHEGQLFFNQWTPAAALVRQSDPDRAAAFVWAWDQQRRPGAMQHDNGFTELAGDQSDLLARATPQLIRDQLRSAWLPGFGAVLRAHAGDANETYLGFRQGYLASHSDANQGDFVIYAKGAPLTTMSLFGYAMRQYDEYKRAYAEFGWHSRVRFGRQDDDGGWPGGGPVSGVHRHYFSDSADYLRAIGDYRSGDAVRWTRQLIFLKSRQAEGPNYFIFRDSFRNLARGDRTDLPQTWWYQRTLGKREQVAASPGGFDYASEHGARMNVRFLQPPEVGLESRQVQARGPMYNHAARLWQSAGSPVWKRDHESSCTVEETVTINAAGPIAPGQDVVVVIYPRASREQAPRCESLGEGAAKVVTTEGTDYVFANPDGMNVKVGDVAFEGVAGAVRVLGDEVHLIIAEGHGTVSYKGFTLKAGRPTTKVVPLADVMRGGTVEVPAAKTTIDFALDDKAGKVEQVAPGVRKQATANGLAYEFAADKPIRFERDGIIFVGRRGGVMVDGAAGTLRLVMLEGRKIGRGSLMADVASGPYDLTFHADKVVGVAEGPGRFIHVTMPPGLVQLPALTIGGISYAPGTHGGTAIVPVLEGRCEFTLENLKQPPVFRRWQMW